MSSSKRPIFRTPVDIQQQDRVVDELKGYALSFSTVYSTLAERIDMSGSESVRAAALANTFFMRFKMRWPPSIPFDASYRLVDKTSGLAYNVRDISGPDQHYRYVTLLCERIPGSTGA